MASYSDNVNGRYVDILEGMYADEWGIVQAYDGEYYYVALWGDTDSILCFEPNEIMFRYSRR